MESDDSAFFQRLRERQKQNARLYTRSFLPHWLSPLIGFLGLHFALISLVITFTIAFFGWASMSEHITNVQKTLLFL